MHIIMEITYDDLRWLNLHTIPDNEACFLNAAKNGELNIFKAGYSIEVINECIYLAIKYDHMELFIYLLSGVKFNISQYETAFNIAAESGNIEIVKYLSSTIHNHRAFVNAVENGHLDVVKYIHSLSPVDDKVIMGTFPNAAINNHLDVAKYLIFLSTNTNWDNEVFKQASETDSLEIIKLLVSISTTDNWYESAFEIAAANGNVDIMKYLVSITNTHFNYNHAFGIALGYDHVHAIKYLLSIANNLELASANFYYTRDTRTYLLNHNYIYMEKSEYKINNYKISRIYQQNKNFQPTIRKMRGDLKFLFY